MRHNFQGTILNNSSAGQGYPLNWKKHIGYHFVSITHDKTRFFISVYVPAGLTFIPLPLRSCKNYMQNPPPDEWSTKP